MTFSPSKGHASFRNKAQYPIQTYCSPTASCTGRLSSCSDLHNTGPDGRQCGLLNVTEAAVKHVETCVTSPVQRHTCSHPVCGRYEDTARERIWSVHCNGGFKTTDFFSVYFTWLESPMQVSGMSQPLTASRHVTPLNSYCYKHPEESHEGGGTEHVGVWIVHHGLEKQQQTL